MSPKISIIVPVYKVEKYIYKCIDSILNQTFKDFELILVDDGSPDNCGKICDEYAKKDSRIVVIHKSNGGQSSARNAGLDISRGEYIGFVDSDDWIDEDMYELLYRICIENNCDIASCTSKIYYKDRIVINTDHKLIVHNTKEAMKTLLEGKLYDEVVYEKIYKRSLFNNLRFPVGIVYEDTAFSYKIIHKAKRIGSIGEAKYNYLKRDNSTMDNAIKNIRTDAVHIYEDMYKFMCINYPELEALVILKMCNSAMVVLNLISYNKEFLNYKDKYIEVSEIINKYFRKTIRIKSYPITVKILLILLKINPMLYKYIIIMLEKKYKK